ncbi:MAG: hypothetical protein IT385_08290 [Deltaproteobacteria bacterium]|nr:hypothetical protein [Deltaproteobacteria bacterium]
MPAPGRRSALVTLALLLLEGTACGAPERLRSEREQALDLREVSGLAIGTLAGHGAIVLAVGDEARAVTLVPLVDGVPDTTRALAIALPLPEDPGGSQLEGVALVGERLWVLSEGPLGAMTELAIEGDVARVVRTGPLVVPPDHPIGAAWAADANLRGEGLVVDGERVLVAKQRDPAALIAFTFAGDRWTAGATWRVDTDELSDLARGPGGDLYTIGASTGLICRLGPLPDGGGDVACAQRWALPDKLGKGKTQWEGLAFLPDGRPLVAVDRKKSDTPNLAILPRLGTPTP